MDSSGIDAAVTVEESSSCLTLNFSGALTALRIARLETYLSRLSETRLQERTVFNCERITDFDSAGAIMLLTLKRKLEARGCECTMKFAAEKYDRLLRLTEEHMPLAERSATQRDTFLERIGKETVRRFHMMVSLAAFIGMASTIGASYLYRLKNIRYKEMISEIHESAIKAIGVIGLITFLIGVVIAYQSSLQLKLYGANIFIVDMLGIGIFRELAPLLVAVVVAGRSGSAYAAQIGVMKITEELDAMRTMGFDPYAFLVLPRMIALMLMMPVLIFFADIMGVLGGMLVSKIELGISPEFFLERFRHVIDIRHFWVGVVKGPFFALLIASIGIYRGLQVKNDTQSIGLNTTRSVVESIFAVIICDAIFSIIFTNLEM